MRAQGAQRAHTRGREGTRIAIPRGAGDPETRRAGGGGALTGGGAGAGPKRLQSPQTKSPCPAHRSRPRVPPTRGPGLCVRALRRTPPSQVSEPSAPLHPHSPSTPLSFSLSFPRPLCLSLVSPPGNSICAPPGFQSAFVPCNLGLQRPRHHDCYEGEE